MALALTSILRQDPDLSMFEKVFGKMNIVELEDNIPGEH